MPNDRRGAVSLRVVRVEAEHAVSFEVHEGRVYEETGEPKATLKVDCWKPSMWNRPRPAEVSWPAVSDRRPELARALAEALRMAADEADRISAAASASTDGRTR